MTVPLPKPHPDKFYPFTLFRFGVGPRPAFPTHITSREYRAWLDEWDRARVALAWIAAGRPAPRPSILWRNEEGKAVTPGWLGKLRAALAKAGHKPTPLPEPKPMPEPTTKQQLGMFGSPGAWLSWAVLSFGWDGARIRDEARAIGAKWVTLDATINPVGERNLAVFSSVRDVCANGGVTAGLWGEIHSGADAANRCKAVGAPFYIVNREALWQTEPTFLHDFRAIAPAVKLAVVAGPFDAFPHPDLDKPGWQQHVVDEGWLALPMLVEAYTDENPNALPANQAAEAHFRGFEPVNVVVESNGSHGWSLDRVPDDTGSRFGRALSLYLLETATDADKGKFRRMVG